jgi:hypothetical protein
MTKKSCDTCKWIKGGIECTNPKGACPICTKNYPKWETKGE